jgi:hypothetical protein
MTKKRDIEPTPEDYAKVREDMARGPDLLDILARGEARRRVDAERRERRRRLLRRLLRFRRAA